ncbi:hypothetical protein BV364_05775 [Pseudomonas syringae pv. actinidiae]|nr:hypothetical protein BV364_05775 [Pseudomonas syringae pv. actinidiae]
MFADKTVDTVWPFKTFGIRKLVTDGEQVILAVLKDIVRALGLIVHADGRHQWRKYFPLFATEIFCNRQTDTTHLESGTPHVFVTRWHRAKFGSPYCVRAAFTGDIAFKHHVQLAVIRINERTGIAKVPARVLRFGLIIRSVGLEQFFDQGKVFQLHALIGRHNTATYFGDRCAGCDAGVIKINIAFVIQQYGCARPLSSGGRYPLGHYTTTKDPVLAGTRVPVAHACAAMTIFPVTLDVITAIGVEVLRIIGVTVSRQGQDNRPAVDRNHRAIQLAQRHGIPDEYRITHDRKVRTDQWLRGGRVIFIDLQRIGAGPDSRFVVDVTC